MEGVENLKRVPSSMEAEKSVLGGIFLSLTVLEILLR